MLSFVSCTNTINELIKRIKNENGGAYLRFGDGDFNIATGKDDMLARVSKDFTEKMRTALSFRDDKIMICMPHHCKLLDTIEPGICPGNHEYPDSMVRGFLKIMESCGDKLPENIYSNIALSYCSSRQPDLVIELHKEIQKHNVLFIGNKEVSNDLLLKLFGTIQRIDVPFRDAYASFSFVITEFGKYIKNYSSDDFILVIMASGCAGRVFSSELFTRHKNDYPKIFFLDYGSLLDYFNKNISRAYMKIDPPMSDYILSKI